MKLVSKIQEATCSQTLTRLTACAGGWVAGDNDMNTVWVKKPNAGTFVPAVQALFATKNQQRVVLPGTLYASPNASRAYLPSLAALPDGGAVLCCKLGVKEVEASGIPFDSCEWGMYLVCFNADGSLRWKGGYKIHKGNAQVVTDPYYPGEAILVASTGIVWKIDVANGAIKAKAKVGIGATGEKNAVSVQPRAGLPGVVTLSFVGYSSTPCAVLRFGVDQKPVAVASKPPYNDMGDDTIYCRTMAASGQPQGIWWAAVLGGHLVYNFVGPKMLAPRYLKTALPVAAYARCEPRHAPSLFQIDGDRKHVGVAYASGGHIKAQVLDVPGTQIDLGEGSFPVSLNRGGGTVEVRLFKNNQLWLATLTV